MRSNKKGFTLVEVIIVLVIIAILAAILIPALTGYIDKANDRSLIAECRTAVMASQTVASENYALGEEFDTAAAQTLSELSGTISDVAFSEDGGATVQHLTYTRDGRSVVYCRSFGDCNAHSEMYTIDGVGIMSTRLSSAGNNLQALYKSLPQETQNRLPRIDSTALSNPSSTASSLYKELTPAQREFLDGYEWCIVQQTNPAAYGPRVYLADKDEVAKYRDGVIQNFYVYKYNPTTGRFQYIQDGTLSGGKLNTSPESLTKWYDTMEEAVAAGEAGKWDGRGEPAQ